MIEALHYAAASLSRHEANHRCGGFLTRLKPLYRDRVLGVLLQERLARKQADAAEILRQAGTDWNQTLYLLLLRYLGDMTNRDAYTTLATRIPYRTILRERRALPVVEALLLGGAGLLERFREDEYIRELRRDFAHFQYKYAIEPLPDTAWKTAGIRPVNHPAARLVELSALLAQHHFLLETVLECRTSADVQTLFSAEASPYWSEMARMTLRIGEQKSDLYGINVVALLQYHYSSFLRDHSLCTRALQLLDSIAPEQNHLIAFWRASGVIPASARDTQALLQLHGAYCAQRRCAQCPVGMQILDNAKEKVTICEKIPIFEG